MEVRTKVTDEALMISRSSRNLNMELTCPVCLRLLTKTEIVMECLHRFCGECIQKCLRVGKNECPSCRIHVPSRRSLRPDPNFDALIAKVYPDVDAFERYEERCIAAFHKTRSPVPAAQQPQQRNRSSRPLSPTTPGGARRPSTTTAAAGGAGHSGGASAAASSKRPPTGGAAGQRSSATKRPRVQPPVAAPATVNFVLRVHPHETGVPALAREYLETSDQLKIQHLKKFLGLKLKYSPMDDFEILIALQHQCVVLNENLSIAHIIEHFCQANDLDQHIVLHYRLARPTGI